MNRSALVICGWMVWWVAVGAGAEAYREQAQADIMPWSGYWWPLSDGGLVGPLSKYDQATGRAAVAWEKAHRRTGSGVPHWFGFCHAWAASSIMEAEPQQARTWRDRGGSPLDLAVGDQKGMLAACHTDDVAHSYGQRFNEGDGEEARQDIAPDALWRVLKLYLGSQRVPVVLDIEPGPEVWNFPVYAYQVQSDQAGDGPHEGVLTLWLVDDGVSPDYVGTQVRRVTYTFRYEMRGGAVVLGSGRWTGRSQQDHPDFAWFPYLPRADNPQVDRTVVQQLVGQASPAPTPAPPSAPLPQPQPPEVASRPQPRPRPNDPTLPPVLSPVELAALVANRTSAFPLDVTVDRFDGGTYRPGEPIWVQVTSGRAGFLYLFCVDPQGNLALWYPPAGHPGRIDAHTPTRVPGPNDAFVFRVSTTPGVYRIKAVVTTRRIVPGGLVTGQQQHQQQPQQQPRPQQQRQPQQPEQPQQQRVGRLAAPWQTFRWPPAQQAQVQAILGPYAAQDAPPAVRDVDPRQIVGPFAQDQVLFVVARSGKPGQQGGSAKQAGVWPIPQSRITQ